MDFIINSYGGRIGELWWLNSNPSAPFRFFIELRPGVSIPVRVIQWGTCGIGRDIKICCEHLND